MEGLAKPAVLWSPGPLVPWSLVPWPLVPRSSGSLVSGPVISGPAVLWFLDLLVQWSPVHRFWPVVSGPLVRGSLVPSGLLFAVGGVFWVIFFCILLFFFAGGVPSKARKEGMPGERKEGRKEGRRNKEARKEGRKIRRNEMRTPQ